MIKPTSFIGNPCRYGHTEKYVRNNKCAVCSRAGIRKWSKKNPDTERTRCIRFEANNPEYRSEWRSKNIDRMNYLIRRWVRNNPERVSDINHKWSINNRPAIAVKARNKRAKLKLASGSHTKGDIADIKTLQLHRCALCKIDLDDEYHVDHIMPIALGGGNGRRNLQILCSICNLRKGALDPIDFNRSNGMLL